MRAFVVILFCSAASSALSDYDVVPNWPDPSVLDLHVYGSGLSLDPDGNVVLFHRSDRMVTPNNTHSIPVNTVLVIHPTTGKIIRGWGKDKFFHPHGIHIERNGDLYLTDVRLCQIFKFEVDNVTKTWKDTPSLTIGEAWVQGSDKSHFCGPADIVVSSSGDIYVADGYCNSRVVKFDQAGTYITEWGAGGSNSIVPVPFNITHSLALVEEKGMMFVADRDNARLQSFDMSDGRFLYEIGPDQFGGRNMLLATAYSADGLIAVNGLLPIGQPRIFQIEFDRTAGHVVKSFPVTPFPQEARDQVPHDVAVSEDGRTIYVVEGVTGLILWKYERSSSASLGLFISPFVAVFTSFISILISYLNSVN